MTHPTNLPSPLPPTADPAAQFDAFHAARARTDLVARLYAAAMGDDYPHEVAASSSCDWPLLGLMTARLKMRPGQMLVDAGCGTGGIGLWLARALALRLEGIDISPVALTRATKRRSRFVPADRAAFRVASLDATGLPDGCAHGVVCVDTLSFTQDRGEAVRELGRILAPGGRLTLTRSARQGATPVWEDQAHAAGLTVEHIDERPGEPAMWERLYQLWLAHADDLQRELGDVQARNMLYEAHRTMPALHGRRAVLLTLRRPPTRHVEAGAADRISEPGRPGDGPATSERTPQ
ncbi:methyltransferase domain-containing protein (plasmid) [Streptomyces europaeiscabiei]|uniref:class I SAM-dependent methyltransferase n=1 Tax=Streptomyces europaeiscabiei TaxID=146819 RepID=UPI002E819A79|nr:methyltransferase domain-containing protein [Streptomyces europaeiscabiei]WUD38804.1 methyltransferase domain-containing protein [Streptomyces europaeiscabiei]